MSKKPLIITLAVVLTLFLLVLIGYYFVLSKNSDGTDGSPSIFRSFFPFGGGEVKNEPVATSTEPSQNQPDDQTSFLQKLRKLSSDPVAGAGTQDVRAGTIVRYIEVATGHIYETELYSPKTGRISNTTIPVVYDAEWGKNNISLIARYLEDDDQSVDTYSLTIKQTSTTTENAVSATALPSGISDVSVNGDSVFYLQQSDTKSNGFVSGVDGSRKKQIWSSPIKELNSQFVNSRTVALTTKPAPNMPGFLYFVDTNSGSVRKVLGDAYGLSTLVAGDESKIMYIEQTSDIYMKVLDLKTNITQQTSPVTFPEKCVWSKKTKDIVYCAVPQGVLGGNSLTDWYRGVISTTDDIWKYDIKNNTSSLIENLTDDSGEKIDVIKPILSENEQYLVFINKRDGSLWSLDLTK